MNSLSPNTQAILLLTAPLIVGKGSSSAELLTASEYKRLARFLLDKQRQPADLLATEGDSLIRDCQPLIEGNRLKRLLERGFLLSQAMERWQTRAIWVVSRADTYYPKRLKTHLKEDAPPVLYGCGEMSILNSGGLAVVGSRNVDAELITYTENVGRLAAGAERTLVSGGARGIDQAAMRGALEAEGRVIGVLADSLERAAMNRENRSHLMAGRLVLVSPYDPSAGFNVGHAMQRNKLIYALSDAALVVNSDYGKGGTWAGAVEQLDKLKYVPLYVRTGGIINKGLDGLRHKGAIPWPNPSTSEELAESLSVQAPKGQMAPIQGELQPTSSSSCVPQSNTEVDPSELAPHADSSMTELAQELFAKVAELLLRLQGAHSESEIATILNVSKSQAHEWLEKALKEGLVQKRGRPAQYSVIQDGQRNLFNG